MKVKYKGNDKPKLRKIITSKSLLKEKLSSFFLVKEKKCSQVEIRQCKEKHGAQERENM